MDVLDVARWQFGITTVYHFLMVPLTIGLALLVAGMQTAWYRTGKPRYLAMTKFWGKLMMINFAMGVVTGIVQEFQFGMTWSAYSRFVGDVFGAPLAMEGLVAFFVESTFLGLWIFGWDRLSRRVHLACVWAFSLATAASAYFILAANSWMQHPVGVELVDGRPRLTSIWAVLGNNTVLAAFPHTLAGAFAVAATLLVGVSAWHLWHKHRDRQEERDAADPADRAVWQASLRLGGWVGVLAFAAVAISGDAQGKLMFEQQPMKMAAAEALCHTEAPASFSVFAYGDVSRSDCENVKSINLPALLSFLAHSDFTTEVKGVQDLIPEYQAKYGTHYPVDERLGALSGQPIDYVPVLPVTYWGFRLMIGFGAVAAGAGVLALWLTRRGRIPRSRWFPRLALASIATPFLANSVGWIFTEMGRQPFVVVPNPSGVDGVWMYTATAVSNLSVGEVLTSLITLTLVYGVLAGVEVFLLRRYARAGVAGVMPAGAGGATGGGDANDRDADDGDADDRDGTGGRGGADRAKADDVLSFAY
ncbi:cytochrome ubiquinol oxidase subunit I [Goodfellowiella coeruleoviolacea]|uniref:Cytochrome bd-I ubiquinol oxidase subunit 1 apoprotein n=1 Tax=Goodfellowiella coeruleoviolacea TaxID=334858 RepID=A0AAE3G9X1_9PSEU|nr:cytochrome ubiquinol oxidase subunit I [Goodfellowiella coeruleoviolacea]MCP2164366.1 cytochrome bd-I ubiquinol oxidase subunit 1 apoprotein (EC 1.10.3.10) [Goodfellowiella coeruleoviolacea]